MDGIANAAIAGIAADKAVFVPCMPDTLSYASLNKSDTEHRRPRTRSLGVLAALATFVIVGAGHMIVGRWRRGLAWFASLLLLQLAVLWAACSERPDIWLLVGLVLLALNFLACLIDAYRVGRRSTALARLSTPAFGVIIVGVIALFVVNPVAIAILLAKPLLPIEAFVMPTASMEPTLVPDDRFLVNRRREPQRWDVVAFRSANPGAPIYGKRVIGMPGDRIEVGNDATVFVNGSKVELPDWHASLQSLRATQPFLEAMGRAHRRTPRWATRPSSARTSTS